MFYNLKQNNKQHGNNSLNRISACTDWRGYVPSERQRANAELDEDPNQRSGSNCRYLLALAEVRSLGTYEIYLVTMALPLKLTATLTETELRDIIKAHFQREGFTTGEIIFELADAGDDRFGSTYKVFSSAKVTISPKKDSRAEYFDGGR